MVYLVTLSMVILLCAAAYVAPRCQPGQEGTVWGGMLMQGCAVRDLKTGMSVKIGDDWNRISKIGFMNGKNGDPPTMIAGSLKSALAVKIEFEDRTPIVSHPAERMEISLRPSVRLS